MHEEDVHAPGVVWVFLPQIEISQDLLPRRLFHYVPILNKVTKNLFERSLSVHYAANTLLVLL